jgi:hypothetical protein
MLTTIEMDDHEAKASAPDDATPGRAVVQGPRDPASGTPPRRPGGVRRTTSVDGRWPEGGGLVLVACGRDLLTGPDGGAAASVSQSVVVETAPDMVVRSIEATPALVALDPLVGQPLRGSFRKSLSSVAGLAEDRANLLHMLLDDVVATALIAGYARQRALPPGALAAAYVEHMADICAGWAADAQMLAVARSSGRVPLVVGPPAPVLEDPGDPLAWHELPPIAPGVVRRRRRTDVTLGPSATTAVVDAMFRDAYQEPDGTLSVLHEYSVTARVERTSGRLAAVRAEPRVLPAAECPAAASSAARMVGAPLADLRQLVRRDLVGTTTCTHLNDELRSLADLPALLRWAGSKGVGPAGPGG